MKALAATFTVLLVLGLATTALWYLPFLDAAEDALFDAPVAYQCVDDYYEDPEFWQYLTVCEDASYCIEEGDAYGYYDAWCGVDHQLAADYGFQTEPEPEPECVQNEPCPSQDAYREDFRELATQFGESEPPKWLSWVSPVLGIGFTVIAGGAKVKRAFSAGSDA